MSAERPERGSATSERRTTPRQHGVLGSTALHLLPGVPLLFAYLYVFSSLSTSLGLPRQFGSVLRVLFVLAPVQLGLLAYFGWKENGSVSLLGAVRNRQRLPPKQLALLVFGLMLWALAVIALLSRLDDAVFATFFSWVPASLLPEEDVSGYSRAALIGTHLASLVAVGLIAPIVEELYFRGFLLPRVAWMGRWAPVWNTVLFNAYHFWSPWRLISRTVFTLPMVYAVWRKRSLSIGIWWHCLGNVLGELAALYAVLELG